MPQDAFTLFHTAKELDRLLRGAKINKVSQPDKDDVYLLTYSAMGSRTLVLSANAENCRVGFTENEKPNPKIAPNFCMLLRKHLPGSEIQSVELVGFERIVKITFNCKNDFRENVVKILYCEIMGKYSNLILTENGIILGCLKNAPLDVATTRVTLSGAKYSLPKPQDKADVFNRGEIAEKMKTFNGNDLPKFLFENIKGMSFPTAAECSARVTLEGGDVAKQIENFLLFPEIRPNIAGEGKLKDVYVADHLTIGGNKTFFDEISAAADNFYSAKERTKLFDSTKKKLLDKVNGVIKKLNKKLQGESEKIAEAQNLESLKLKGELLTANLWKIKEGEEFCVVENYYDEYKPVKISLDKTLSPNRNAQRYFKKYAKQKRALEIIIPQKLQTEKELEYLSTVNFEISQAQTVADFKDIETELVSAGLLPAPKFRKKAENESTYRVYEIDGFTIKCGKNNLQNDRLTGRAFKDDLWLHTKNYHSAHVIIETKGEGIPDKIVEIAAEICAYYSDARGGNKVPVDYALKKFVKKPPQSKPGSVIYTDYKTCFVDPSPHDELAK